MWEEYVGRYMVLSDSDNAVVLLDGGLVKLFEGESAWSDAERWAYDNSPNPHL